MDSFSHLKVFLTRKVKMAQMPLKDEGRQRPSTKEGIERALALAGPFTKAATLVLVYAQCYHIKHSQHSRVGDA